MRPKLITLTPTDANLTGFASNVTGATWTLSNTSTTDGLAHRVSIRNDTANDHSGKTAIVVGTDEDGLPLTETALQLPAGNATVETTGYFKTVISVTPSATIGGDTMDIGWVDEISTQTVPLDWRNERIGIYVDITGTIDYTVQDTGSDTAFESKPFIWQNTNDLDVVDATTSQKSTFFNVPRATRLVVNSYSSGATLTFRLIQMDNSWH